MEIKSRFDHFNINVTDLERSIAFYEKAVSYTHLVAEYTVALMLSLNRKIPRASWRTRDGNFSLHGLLGFDMHGKTAGIIGTGKIAKILIHILKGFGMNILAYDLYPDYNFARENQIVYTTPVSYTHLFIYSYLIY